MRPTMVTQRLVAVSALIMAAGMAQADVSDSDLARLAGDEWLHSNGSWDGSRFSTLSQLTPSNAGELHVKWIYSIGGQTDTQATPLYHDGLIYLPQDNAVHAVDARSGTRVWKYDWELPQDWGGQFSGFVTGKHRGLAISGANIYFLSNDCTLIALNAKSGAEAFAFKIDRPYNRDFDTAEDAAGYTCTVGPMAIPGQIIVPMNGTDFGGLQGYVDSHSPDTGEQLWAANMIPAPGEPGGDTWPGDSRIYGGGGPWIIGTWDPELKMYYTGTVPPGQGCRIQNRGSGCIRRLGPGVSLPLSALSARPGIWRTRGLGRPDQWSGSLRRSRRRRCAIRLRRSPVLPQVRH